MEDFGLTLDLAWGVIVSLNISEKTIDDLPFYNRPGEEDALVFKRKMPNGKIAYIKINIENDENGEDLAVCISFH